jgi:starch-binding outer membrane protein, SusD/RagB family
MKNIIFNQRQIIIRLLFLFALLPICSCEEFISVDAPKTEIVSSTVFSDEASALSAIRGIYSLMMSNQSFTNGGLELYTGLSSDELMNYSSSPEQLQFFTPSLLPTNSIVLNEFWKEAYQYINNANAIIEGLDKSSSISDDLSHELEGEARFIRAFCHFYLVNLFGDVPYVTSTDYHINASITRQPVDDIYGLIINDLEMAYALLSNDFKFSNGLRVQPNKAAAASLLARIYLYKKDWENAVKFSSIVINNPQYSLESDLNNVFLGSSNEAIWQLLPVLPEKSTAQARFFILTQSPSASGSYGIALSDELYNSFEPNDKRKDAWVNEYSEGLENWRYAYKYKVTYATEVTEYVAVIRLAELYLIRSEALANQNKLNESIADVDIIRARAGLPLILNTNPGISQADLLLSIEQERRMELFSEGGHRWLDLKRTNRADDILTNIKVDYQFSDLLYPIPQSERTLNPMLTQNPGY